MNPSHRFGLALVLCTLAVLCGPRPATAASSPPPPALKVTPAEWDTLQSFEDRLMWAAQESLATVLLRRVEGAPSIDSLEYSRALLNVAIGRLRRRLFRDGVGFDALDRSIAIRQRHAPPGDVQLSRGYWTGATFYTEFGQPERALVHADSGLRVTWAGHPVDTLQVTRIETQRASALVALGRLDEARAAYAHALTLRAAKFGAMHRVLVPPLAEYGVFLSRMGEFDAARAHLSRALAIAEADTAPNSDLLEGTLMRLSSFEDRAGNVAESMELAQRAWDVMAERRGPDDVMTLRSRTMVAYRLEELGDPEGAAAHLSAIVPRLDAQLGPANPQVINARLVWIEMALASSDTATARRELLVVRPALAGQERLFNENRAHLLVLDSRLARAAGDQRTARDSIDEAIRLEWPKRDPLGETLASLLTHALDGLDGPADRARLEHLNEEVARMNDSTRVRGTVAWTDVRLAQARAEARVGMGDLAWEHALEAERRSRERFRYELESLSDTRALQLGRRIGGAEQVLVRLAEPGDEARVATAWDRVVRWRGLVRHEVARRRAPAETAAAGDTALLAAHARWIAAQRRLAQWAVSGWADPDDPETAARFQSARNDAEQSERAYARLAPSHADAGADTLVNLERMLARLAPDQALVAYVVSATGPEDATLGAFVARGTDRRPRYVALEPLPEVERDVRAWVAALATPPSDPAEQRALERSTRALGRTVRERVWAPLAREIGDARRVLVVPEGVMFELPWMALPSGSTRYLADEDVAIEVLGAERELIDTGRTTGAGLLAVGGPDFDRGMDMGAATTLAAANVSAPELRARRLPCAATMGALPALPGARAEVADIARDWGGDGARLLVGADATEGAFKRDAPGRRILHLATHGVVLEDTCLVANEPTRGVGGVVATSVPARASKGAASPLAESSDASPRVAPSWLRGRVWLALAGANRPLVEAHDENEGLLTAEEVVTLDLRGADWVVLSACQSGVAPTWAHEGVLGMRRAFHLAGARSVIASQWPVADEATREWMTALYAARQKETGSATGVPVTAGGAVREACRSTLGARRKDGRSTLPFYWAAFTSTGI